MKFVTVEHNHETFVGLVDPDESKVILLNPAEEARTGKRSFPSSMQECIDLGESFIEQVQVLYDWVISGTHAASLYVPMEEATLLAPIPRPNKNIFCVGKNYAEHAIEMGSEADIPEHVMVFTKAPTTVIGPNETVLNHQDVTNQLDYEGELAVIIGKKGRAIKKEEALDYIFGYTILNDVTARDLQSRHKQFFIGKSLDTTCPMGPWIIHKSVIENPNHLHIETRVNGEVRQNSNTKNFIFPIEEVISVLSAGMTLEPGDIIATGTPAGVGKGLKPPKFLSPGDQMEVTIEKIGTLKNTIKQ
ncbi:fumarylacetoacetate hydrolase family protein [Bacillus sp. ISL-40]|uniref:fumarylacetoacetate hydrolase family protein n=1 Tax=unclassified Bacillus (in: firmicutes) TaxID=185979 RepID=UPI001BEC8E3A|nr:MULTISPECIES: fumarylacetoacetate hydrolase family protein [unclassified Bacillus (in: firmicutes)]MBT2697078.1 fumarylacetoacetate hydrolase family protein [Bacillus sp. ISL-40]MBT2740381.1 fumarylacetoacetate hydrolase family protein [Bacillus sp. ISL-77]